MGDSYYQRVQRLTEIYRDDPILLALHESTTNSLDGRKWGDILVSEWPLTRSQRKKQRNAKMKGSWRQHMYLPNANVTNEIVEQQPIQ